MSDNNQVTFNFDPYSKSVLDNLAKNLNTDAADVMSQALVLFKMAQGKKVVFQDDKTQTKYVINKYQDQPAQK